MSMTVTVLVENRACGPASCAHGLSLHIQTNSQSILFDFGPDGDLLLRNADTLGIDLAGVDLAVLSHGHDDHSGGLKAFLRANDHAPVFMHKLAIEPHYSRRQSGLKYISPDPGIIREAADRIQLIEGTAEPSHGLTLFSDIPGTEMLPGSNSTLYEEADGALIRDRFLHEQDLLVHAENKLVLFAGCAHRGILNILRRAEELSGRMPDHVFSGFHLTNPGLGQDEPEALVRGIGSMLASFHARYFTGHCTGEGPYAILQGILGDRLTYMGCGLQFTI